MKRKINQLILQALFATTVVTSGFATSPLVNINDKVYLLFNGSATGRYVSNVFADNTNRKDDFISILSPGVELMTSENAELKVKAFFREDFYFYATRTKLDTQNANVIVFANYDKSRLSSRFFFTFYQTDQPTPAINFRGALVSRAVWEAKIQEEYRISTKTAVGGVFEFHDTYFRSGQPGLVNYQIYTIPVVFWYKYSPKLEFGPAYRFRYTDMRAGGRDRVDHFVNFAARGELAPKLMGEVNVGVQHRHIYGRSTTARTARNTIGFALISKLTYKATEKITVDGGVNRDYSVGSTGQSINNFGGNVNGKYQFTEIISALAGFSYNRANYQFSNRKDNTYNGNIGVGYDYNKYVRLGAGYTYQYNDSNISANSYVNNIVNVTASLRY